MRKHPCYLLASSEEPPLLVGTLWGRGPVLVLGRQFCVHFTLDATGVPGRRVADFADLQVNRLSPFAQCGGVFVRQGDKVHVWVWPQEMVTAQQLKLNAGKGSWRVLPESLWGDVPARGTVVRNCVAGVEALRFDGGDLQDAMWWPQAPTEPDIAIFSEATPVSRATESTRERVQRGKRWASKVQAASAPGAKAQTPTGLVAWLGTSFAWVVLGWLLLGLAGAYAGWELASASVAADAKVEVQTELDSLLNQGTRGSKSRSGAALAQDVQWVQEVRQLTRGVRLDSLLQQLAQPLSSRGLLLRELVIDRNDVKMALVSGYGGAVDLDEAIAALESMGLWQRVELLDFAHPSLARFSLKLKSGAGEAVAP
jgi:hypothetical protein